MLQLFDCGCFAFNNVIEVLLVKLVWVVDFVKLVTVFVLSHFDEQVVNCHKYLTVLACGGHSLRRIFLIKSYDFLLFTLELFKLLLFRCDSSALFYHLGGLLFFVKTVVFD